MAASSQTSGSAAISTLPLPPSRVGVCVTGEARTFALDGVRASLRRLLDALPPSPLVRMIIARRGASSCSGHQLHKSRNLCHLARHAYFAMPTASLIAEFPEAGGSIALMNSSSCDEPPARESACCALQLRLHHEAPRNTRSARARLEAGLACVGVRGPRACPSHARWQADKPNATAIAAAYGYQLRADLGAVITSLPGGVPRCNGLFSGPAAAACHERVSQLVQAGWAAVRG